MKCLFAIIILATATTTAQAGESTGLSGLWQFQLDPQDTGMASRWFAAPLSGDLKIKLPGTTDEAGYGEKTTGAETGVLTRVVKYYGPAWYLRTIEVPQAWKNKTIDLFLERVNWESLAWVDGRPCNSQESLNAPHTHSLGQLSPGKRPAARQLRESLLAYMDSPRFSPQTVVDDVTLGKIFPTAKTTSTANPHGRNAAVTRRQRKASADAAQIGKASPTPQSLVPAAANTSPDYFCTWNIQGYHSSYATNAAQKDDLCESRLFGKGQYEDWLGQYPKVRGDLFFLMDEGWDLPEEAIKLVPNRFPSYSSATQPENFTRLAAAVKYRGWRGLGLWMRADVKTDDFWTERLKWMKAAGVSYWKVDYGNAGGNEKWRRHLAELGRRHAPHLKIEAAMTPHAVTWADTYRTYDVDVILSIPQTLARVARLLKFQAEPGAGGILNCEDEVYLGAGLGCSYGVMRHSFTGSLPNGRQDFVFPPLTRDVKRCGDEVVRAVRWHRIAPAFAVGANAVTIAEETWKDNWRYGKDESWTYRAGHAQSESAPAAIVRGLPLPEVTTVAEGIKPFVVASRHPNGAVAVATLGRTLCPIAGKRQWVTGEKADIALKLGKYTGPIGVFGRYRALTLVFDQPVRGKSVWAQDLAGETPLDITALVGIVGNELRIPGTLIDRVGLSAATAGDKSEPGLVVVLR